MTLAFQEDLLKFLFQDKSARVYHKYLDKNAFDDALHKQLYDLWAAYVKKYDQVPTQTHFENYLTSVIQKSSISISDAISKELISSVTAMYSPREGSAKYIRDEIIQYAQRKATRELFKEADKIKTAEADDFEKWLSKMEKIVRIGRDIDTFERNRGGMIFKEHKKFIHNKQVEATPIFLKQINRMTAAGGFYSPQNIVFLGAAKRFKTGLLLNIAVDLALTGHRVTYIDMENGVDSLRTRAYQVALDCIRRDVKKNRKVLSNMSETLEKLHADISLHFLPAGSTIKDMEAILEYDRDEHNFLPHAIICDYAHKLRPSDKSIKDRRQQIQEVYTELPSLNQRWGTFSFTVSPVSSDGIDKWTMTEKDYAEDKSIAYNAHAAFAICRIKQEMINGTAHIIPINQREGTGYKENADTTCAIRIDEERMQIEELDSATYIELYQQYIDQPEKSGKQRRMTFKPRKPITDD